jgi:hypothetical protein
VLKGSSNQILQPVVEQNLDIIIERKSRDLAQDDDVKKKKFFFAIFRSKVYIF